jgi:hypothetical protein
VLEFSITFAPEKKLLGKELKKAMDDFHHFTPGTTKRIKSRPSSVPPDDINTVDDGSTRYHVVTTVYRTFSDEEFKGKVTGYDSASQLYHILYEDEDTEVFYHNEVRDQQKPSLHISKRWTKPKKLSTKHVNRLLAKYAPKESDYTEHVMSLTIESIRASASIRYANGRVPSIFLRVVYKM